MLRILAYTHTHTNPTERGKGNSLFSPFPSLVIRWINRAISNPQDVSTSGQAMKELVPHNSCWPIRYYHIYNASQFWELSVVDLYGTPWKLQSDTSLQIIWYRYQTQSDRLYFLRRLFGTQGGQIGLRQWGSGACLHHPTPHPVNAALYLVWSLYPSMCPPSLRTHSLSGVCVQYVSSIHQDWVYPAYPSSDWIPVYAAASAHRVSNPPPSRNEGCTGSPPPEPSYLCYVHWATPNLYNEVP